MGGGGEFTSSKDRIRRKDKNDTLCISEELCYQNAYLGFVFNSMNIRTTSSSTS